MSYVNIINAKHGYRYNPNATGSLKLYLIILWATFGKYSFEKTLRLNEFFEYLILLKLSISDMKITLKDSGRLIIKKKSILHLIREFDINYDFINEGLLEYHE